MSYDMTLPNTYGYGFGGGSGLAGWLGNIGNGWQSGLANNLRMATDLYNFTDRQLLAPSVLNAKHGANQVLEQQNQAQYQDLVNHNHEWNRAWQMRTGQTANSLNNVRPNAVANQNTQVYTPPVNATPSNTQATPYSQQQGLGSYKFGTVGPVQFQAGGPQMTEQQLRAVLLNSSPYTVTGG